MTKYCPECGEKLGDEAKFCKNCGKKLNETVTRAFVPERPVAEKPYTISIVIGYIAALLIPIIGLIVGIYLLTRKDSQRAKKHGLYVIIVSVVIWLLSFVSSLMYIW